MNASVNLTPKERFEGIPVGFTCNAKGVIYLADDDKTEQITTKPIVVKAATRDQGGENWGIHLWWRDQDDRIHERTIPKRLFHATGTELAQMLADGGLPIVPGRERKLLIYLTLFTPKQRLTAADRTGWLNGAFVMPMETLRAPAGERIVYQPSGLSNHTRVMRRNGSLEHWQAVIRDASPVVRFLVCASLSAPVRFMCNVESGGFHIWGKSSHGKTTALQVAASCWGSGADPQQAGGSETYINRWNATDNALEAKSEMHNDLPLIVDEVGEGDSRAFGRTIYRIFSGTGRDRSSRSGELRDSKSWRVSVLSAGEMAVAEFIESGGGKIKGGQLVRLIDIDISKAPPITEDARASDHFKRECAEHYGIAGPALLERISDLSEGWHELDHSLLGPAASPLAERARRRFALVLHTGLLAAKAGILPWTEEAILESVRLPYEIWLEQISTVSDEDRGIAAVNGFILANESRFETGNELHPVRDRAGWIRDGRYCFTPAGFKEACAGANPEQVKKALRDARLLHYTKGLSARIMVNGQSTTVVVVKPEILSWQSNDEGIGGITGNSPVTTRDAANTPELKEEVLGVLQTSCLSASNTPNTPCHTGGVLAESPVTAGLIPPIPPIPPENTKPKKIREVF